MTALNTRNQPTEPARKGYNIAMVAYKLDNALGGKASTQIRMTAKHPLEIPLTTKHPWGGAKTATVAKHRRPL
jgi:hypothetical protein